MIVPVNSDSYHNLFLDAEKFLGLDEGTINDLNAYYGYMREFYVRAAERPEGYRFIMMPLDEEPFRIELNSRDITVPATFTKIGGVQADQMAELVIFETARYFDYMDLANTTIFVQWQLPNGDTGATHIDIKDLESVPGKIRFAWPLHNVITQHSGTVKFSVRFYLIDEEIDEEGKVQKRMAYSLNTVDKSFMIKPALNPAAEIQTENLSGLFEKSIINSSYVGNGRIPPLDPLFEKPGLDLTIVDKENCFVRKTDAKETGIELQIAKLHDNKLILKAQAVNRDSGNIVYDWRFARDDDKLEDGTPLWNTLNTTGKFEYEKAVFSKNSVSGKEYLNQLDRYYYNAGDEENPDWQPYTGTEIPKDIQLYEKYSYYSLPETGDVVGYYAVTATNVIGDLETDGLKSKEVWSSRCYLPGPVNIDFEDKVFSYLVKDGVPEIKVNVKKDINSPDIDYTWYYSALSEEDVINSAVNNQASLSASKIKDFNNLQPGWYNANVHVNLNRKDKYAAPEETYAIYAEAKIDSVTPVVENGDTAIQLAPQEQVTLKVSVVVNPPEGFDESTIAEALYKNLKYRWEYSVSDKSGWFEIKDEDISETNVTKIGVSMNGDTLVIRKPDNETATIRRYRCVVTNDLGEKNAFTFTPEGNSGEVFTII